MRILVVQESDWIKRGPHQQHHLMERLQKKGHTVRVIDYEISWKEQIDTWRFQIEGRRSYNVSGKVLPEIKINVIRPFMIKLPLIEYAAIPPAYGTELLRQIKSFHPDIIIGLGIVNTYIAMRLAKKFNIPFFYYLIDSLHRLIPIKYLRPLGRAIESLTIKSADKIFTINKGLRDYAQQMGGPPEKIIVLGAGIDNKKFNPNVSGTEIRKRYNIAHDELVLFFMGWLYDFSGLKEVVESLKQYRGTTKVRLFVIGKGDLFDYLQTAKEELGSKLILESWQPYDMIPKYIAASDICILPAYNNEIMRDIVPIKIYEYMGCGKPVITTRLPGIIKEFGYNSGIIYVNSPYNVISKAISIFEKGEIKKYGRLAYECAKNHSWDVITRKFEAELIDSIKKLSAS